MIPVVDVFAGPGGLGEGFAALGQSEGAQHFKIPLSIEKDPFAHRTLLFRTFMRQFPIGRAPKEYYAVLKGNLTCEALFAGFPNEAARAQREAWRGAEEAKLRPPLRPIWTYAASLRKVG
jgi:DNA (cytosine-5)-methyltransferase 1